MSYAVIVLEDNALCMDLVCNVLERAGYQPLRAADLQQSLLHAESSPNPVALLIADQLLPSCSGTEVAAALFSSRPHLKCLLISGTPPKYWSAPAQHQLSDLAPAGIDFLAKPFRPAELLRRVQDLLGTAARAEAAAQH